MPGAEVLFVHPHNHPQRDVIPIGSIAAVNLLPQRVLGRYAAELTAEEIRAARVLLVDVHWFPPLAVLDELLAALRRIHPAAPIVVGGITADFYRDAFVQRFPVDYLVTGDVELSLPTLVKHLVEGTPPPALPGVWSRTRGGDTSPRLTEAQFDELDWLSIDWFPTMKERIHEAHRRHRRAPRQVPSDPTYPTLLATRGCVRHCRFCHGGYGARVFGTKTLTRSADGLRRDLTTISKDPALSFVTVFFSDASIVERCAPAWADAHFDLDAYLFFCGTARREPLQALRAAFEGNLVFSVIQPADLEPPGGPGGPDKTDGAFAAMLRHVSQLGRARAAVYHIHEPEAAILAAANDHIDVELVTGRDWEIRRPDLATLATTGAEQQLAAVVDASQHLAALHLLRALVLPLQGGGLPAAFELPSLERRLAKTDDPFLRRLLRLLRRQIVRRGLYGCDELQLRWTRQQATGAQAAWLAPGERVAGDCRWRAALRGFCWQGTVQLEPGPPVALAPVPVVTVAGEKLDFAAWPRTQIPSLDLPAGPRRTLGVGGEENDRRLVLWADDPAGRIERVLEVSDRQRQTTAERSFVESLELDPWPTAQWPRALSDALSQPGARQLSSEWRVVAHACERCHVQLRLRARDGATMQVVVFARGSGRFLSTERFAVAYPTAAAERFRQVQAGLLQLLGAADRILG